ncbi:MAG: hypothetical protein JXO72_05325 [Vicinamibacteria bacterium]|nr:hypothetical protein [Vicinamibacteria bacterium]
MREEDCLIPDGVRVTRTNAVEVIHTICRALRVRGWRPDDNGVECLFDQIERSERPDILMDALARSGAKNFL